MENYCTGNEFNQEFKDEIFVKLSPHDENHNGLIIKEGLVIDPIPFYPYGTCSEGGIYFINIKNIPDWIEYNHKCMVYFRYVTVPDDAEVYNEQNKFKASKLILSKKHDLRTYIQKNKSILTLLNRKHPNKYLNFYFSKQTENEAIRLVKMDSLYFKYVIIKTPKLYVSVFQNGHTMGVIEGLTDDVYKKIININYQNIKYIMDPTKKLLMYTIIKFNKKIDHVNLEQLINDTYTILGNDKVDVEESKDIIDVIKHMTSRIRGIGDDFSLLVSIKTILFRLFVKKSWKYLKYVQQYDKFLHHIALKQSYEALSLIREDQMCIEYYMRALSHSWEAIKLIKEPTEEVCLYAIKKHWEAIKYIDKNLLTNRMYHDVVMQSDDAIDYILSADISIERFINITI
jgi:hypothetical protein